MPDRRTTASQLADLMSLDRSTVTRLVGRLECQRLVERTREWRTTWVGIRPEGMALIPGIHEAWHELYRLYSDELGASKAERVNRHIAGIFNGGAHD